MSCGAPNQDEIVWLHILLDAAWTFYVNAPKMFQGEISRAVIILIDCKPLDTSIESYPKICFVNASFLLISTENSILLYIYIIFHHNFLA